MYLYANPCRDTSPVVQTARAYNLPTLGNLYLLGIYHIGCAVYVHAIKFFFHIALKQAFSAVFLSSVMSSVFSRINDHGTFRIFVAAIVSINAVPIPPFDKRIHIEIMDMHQVQY
jgi:hypothetical protein